MAPPPLLADCSNQESSFTLKEKNRLEIRKDWLQLRGDLHGLQSLQLIGREDGRELRKKGLLRLSRLLLQYVDLDDHRPDLHRTCTGIQQNAKLLRQRLRGLQERHELRLPRLE